MPEEGNRERRRRIRAENAGVWSGSEPWEDKRDKRKGRGKDVSCDRRRGDKNRIPAAG